MGDWIDYSIKFANREGNLSEEMVKKGLASIFENATTGHKSLVLNLKKIDADVFQTGYKPNDGLEHINIGIDGNGIGYVNKWGPDDRLVSAISKHFSEDVFDIERTYTTRRSWDIAWYEKNGDLSTKNGKSVVRSLYNLNSKLVKERDNMFFISLPIGEEGDKWGTVKVPKDNVKYFVYTGNGAHEIYNVSVFFETDTLEVLFKNKTSIMSTNDVVDKYRNSKTAYRKEMQSNVVISGLPRDCFSFRRNYNATNSYYVVKIPCSCEISLDSCISVTVPNYDVNIEKREINLGKKGKSRNTRIIAQDGTVVDKRLNTFFIKECYEKTLINRQANATEERDNDYEQ